MKRTLFTLATIALLSSSLLAQGNIGGGGQVPGTGGTYGGPEDTVPTGAGQPGIEPPIGGGNTLPPTAAGGPPLIAGSGGGLVGGSSGGTGGAGVPLPTNPQTLPAGVDWTQWELWWHYNQHAYLDLRSHLGGNAVITGSDDFFLGHGEAELDGGSLRPTPSALRAEVLPLLGETLRAGQATSLEGATLLALGKVAGFTGETESALQAIKPFLSHSNQAVRERAIAALGILGREQSIDLLASLAAGDTDRLRTRYWVSLGDKVHYRSRAFATYSLGLVGESAADYHRMQIVRALTGDGFKSALATPTPDVAVASILALGLVPLPLDASDTDGAGKRTLVLATRQHQIRWLLAQFDDQATPTQVRAQIPAVVARLLEDSPPDSALRRAALKRMLSALESRDSGREVRQGAAVALGRMADSDEDDLDEEARKELQKAAEKDADQVVRRFALIALGEAAGRPGYGEGDSTAGVRTARRFLSRNLTRGTSQTRPWSGLALGILERSMEDSGQAASSEMREALRTAFTRARSPSEAGGLALACGLARDRDSEEALREMLASGADRVTRSYSALGLGLIGAQGARGELAAVMAESRFLGDMLEACAIALALLDDETAVPQLIAELSRASSLASQAPAANALGLIGDARAIGPLTAMAANGEATQLARSAALTALGRIAQRHELPWNAMLAQRVNYTANPLTLTAPMLGGGVLDLP